MIDASRRLHRAILLNDLLIVKRIINSHPELLTNPDFKDKGNTNLHIAAQAGFEDIVVSHSVTTTHDDLVADGSAFITAITSRCRTRWRGNLTQYGLGHAAHASLSEWVCCCRKDTH